MDEHAKIIIEHYVQSQPHPEYKVIRAMLEPYQQPHFRKKSWKKDLKRILENNGQIDMKTEPC